ncbi:helix-turn-helix transcriptional regulator [Bdellovibrio sp. HCB288]|uniref:helix-turn-helix transcriptional regulator n=1 Tax=Bdellovibrio sp. HCB288 TaxID=3394355 RepID=UPI0039B5F86B
MSTKTKRLGLVEIEKQFGPLTFGRLLKSHRLGEELTQVEMAKQLKMSKQSLNDLEHGRKIPSIRRAIEIARKIEVLEELVVQLILQDHVRREKLNFTVSVSKALKAS